MEVCRVPLRLSLLQSDLDSTRSHLSSVALPLALAKTYILLQWE